MNKSHLKTYLIWTFRVSFLCAVLLLPEILSEDFESEKLPGLIILMIGFAVGFGGIFFDIETFYIPKRKSL